MTLKNNVVWITDADCDSGRAVIRRLAAPDFRFLLNSASGGDAIAEPLQYLRAQGSLALVGSADATSASEVNALLDAAEDRLGAVNIVVHNHDKELRASVEHCEETAFLDCLHYNAKTAFITVQAAGRRMKDRQDGSVILVSSIHAEKPTGSAFAYSAAKGAVKMLAKEASLVLGRHGIRVNTIERGPVADDDVRFESDFSTLYHDYQYKVPNAVLGTHDDLAELVAFLASEQSRYVNGADIRLDGGFLHHYMNFKMKRPDDQSPGGAL